MEFPKLGKHCSAEKCQELDFLPFKCEGCHQIFCLEHRMFSSHHCPTPPLVVNELSSFSCPVCQRSFAVKREDDPNVVIDRHLASGECLGEGRPTPNMCSVENCRKITPVPFTCTACNKKHCATHRHPDDHRCPQRLSNNLKVQMSGDKQQKKEDKLRLHNSRLRELMLEREGRKHKTTKAQEKANNVKLMKMRQVARGSSSIPSSERFHLEVIFQLPTSAKPANNKMLFFSRRWTIGKTIDVAAKEGKLINRNHMPGVEKICLISLRDGQPLPTAETLSSLQEKGLLRSGEMVLLDKLSNVAEVVC